MKQCVNCKVYVDENAERCPLCGKEVTQTCDKEFAFAPFNVSTPKNSRLLAKRIAYLLSALFLVGVLIASAVKKDWGVTCVGVTALAFSWLLVFRFVFFKTNIRRFIVGFSYSAMLLGLLVFAHFDKVLGGGYMWLAVSLTLPIINGGAIICLGGIALIKKNLSEYAFPIFWTSVASLCFVVVNGVLFAKLGSEGYVWVPSVACGAVGVAMLAVLLTAGRKVLACELKKKLFLDNTSRK